MTDFRYPWPARPTSICSTRRNGLALLRIRLLGRLLAGAVAVLEAPFPALALVTDDSSAATSTTSAGVTTTTTPTTSPSASDTTGTSSTIGAPTSTPTIAVPNSNGTNPGQQQQEVTTSTTPASTQPQVSSVPISTANPNGGCVVVRQMSLSVPAQHAAIVQI